MRQAAQHPEESIDLTLDDQYVVARFDEIKAIARVTESQCRAWGWLRDLSAALETSPVAAILYPSTMAGAASLVDRLEQAGFCWRPLGPGTRGCDEGFSDSVAISLRLLDERLIFDGTRVRVPAGYSIAALVHETANRGLGGLEHLAGMKGNLSDALRNDFGGTLWRVIDEVVLAEKGVLKVVPARSALLRNDSIQAANRTLILAATLKLTPGDPTAITIALSENHRLRMVEEPNATPVMRHFLRVAECETQLEYDFDVWSDEAEER